MSKANEPSRRSFLRMAGAGVLSAVALTACSSSSSSVAASSESEAVSEAPVEAEPVAVEPEAPEYPWTWQELDKAEVEKHTYDTFYTHGGCCSAVVSGILETLAEHYGYPYNQISGQMFANGAAGYGSGNLCGSLGGACAILGLFCDAQTSRSLRDELFAWYKTAEFPQYQPEYDSITTVSNSILCADSVGIWMAATGHAMSDPERMARCAGLSANVAVKTVELLNVQFGFEAAPEAEAEPAEEEQLAENEYIGTGTSEIGGEIKVKVTMDGDKIAKVEVLSHNETAGISDPALEQLPDAFVAANSADVDTVSSATRTSEALIEAVKDALAQAGR